MKIQEKDNEPCAATTENEPIDTPTGAGDGINPSSKTRHELFKPVPE